MFTQEDIANPTRDTLAEGIIGLLRPSLETLDMAVVNTRYSNSHARHFRQHQFIKVLSQIISACVRRITNYDFFCPC